MGAGNRVKGSRPKPKSVKAKSVNLSAKRRLSRYGKVQQKGKAGIAAHYVSRAKALKTLQITLRDFRRLCILKGIYPRDPKKKPNKDKNKTYYHIKDISYLAHEPLLDKFRAFKSFMKKVRKRIAKNDHKDAIRMYEQKPEYTLQHLVKERYPVFQDSLHDLDDALCLIHLFAALPSQGSIRVERTEACLSLAKEWQFYIVKAKALRKVFCSVKGMYYQARVHGVDVTWLVPHKFAQNLPNDVDYRVMLTFLEFYQTALAFIMFKLYHSIGYRYPPNVLQLQECKGAHLAALTAAPMETSTLRDQKQNNKKSQSETQNYKNPKNHKKSQFETQNKKKSQFDSESQHQDQDEKSQREMQEIAGQQQPSEETMKKLASLEKKMPSIAAKSAQVEAEKKSNEGDDVVHEETFAGDETSQAVAAIAKHRKAVGSLFSGLVFYISREVPYETMELCLLSFGASIESEEENSERVTHHVTDRTLRKIHASRDYVQPQWVFDCINASMLLPLSRYHPQSKDLPPHLSPFVDDAAEGYTPLYAEEIKRLRAARNANATAPSLVADNQSGLDSLLERNNERDSASDSDSDSDPQGDTAPKPANKSEKPAAPSAQEDEESSEESDDSEEAKEEEPEEKEHQSVEKTTFTASRTFQGSKRGWVFRSGARGVGYYLDTNAKRTVTFRPGKGLSKRAQRKKNKLEAHKRGEMMMSKKAKRLYGRMQHGIKKKNDQIDLLKRKRDQHALDNAAAAEAKSKKTKGKGKGKKRRT